MALIHRPNRFSSHPDVALVGFKPNIDIVGPQRFDRPNEFALFVFDCTQARHPCSSGLYVFAIARIDTGCGITIFFCILAVLIDAHITTGGITPNRSDTEQSSDEVLEHGRDINEHEPTQNDIVDKLFLLKLQIE